MSSGTVQAYITRARPFWMRHFGRPQYDRDKPIVTESLRRKGQEVCDLLNAGSITTEEAEARLEEIRY